MFPPLYVCMHVCMYVCIQYMHVCMYVLALPAKQTHPGRSIHLFLKHITLFLPLEGSLTSLCKQLTAVSSAWFDDFSLVIQFTTGGSHVLCVLFEAFIMNLIII